MPSSWKPEPQLGEHLYAAVADILASQNENGQFGGEPWICQDQNVLLSLAATWSLEGSPHFHSEEVLEAIGRGGKALVEAQDEEGMWIFRKKDHSTWGPIFMPWTYSRWIRAYQLVRDALPAEIREVWERGLILGYEGIARTALERIHNIPTHHAMGLYCAGTVFGRQDWQDQARAFMGRVVDAQSEHGWWSENFGPVVSYNFVYSESLGTYCAMSGDLQVLDALERAARFHANYVYPDGSVVETVDERNPYHRGVRLGNVGFSLTPAGRGFLQQQHGLHLASGGRFDTDYAASMLLYGEEGECEPTAAGQRNHRHAMGEEALVVREGNWFVSLSAYVCTPPEDRWRQDRQNFLSLFHDRTGLIVGGGNARLQPLWSTFAAGNTGLLHHVPGNEEPNFGARPGLIHLPERVSLSCHGKSCGLELRYGEEDCRVTVEPLNDAQVRLVYAATQRGEMPVEAHVPLVPRLDEPLCLSSGERIRLGEERLELSAEWISHAGWKLSLPVGARLVWPALPHNPYRKGGEATIEEGLMVVVVSLSGGETECELLLQVL